MKPLLVLGKIFLVACLWSLFFIEGIRVVLLINWHFDIFWPPHWAYLWKLWHSGWVIDHAKEWAFILILLAAIPMWLTGWIFLSVINWSKIFELLVLNPIRQLKAYIYDINAPARNDLAVKRVVKKKSYKEIRPNLQGTSVAAPYESHPVSVVIKDETAESEKSAEFPRPSKPTTNTSSAKASVEEKKPFTHSVFDFDDDDEDFDLDFDYAVKSIREKQAETQNDEEFEDNEGEEIKKGSKSSHGRAFDDFENDIRDEDIDEDEEDFDDDYEEERPSKKNRQKHKRQNDFDDEDDRPQRRDRNRNPDRKENRRNKEEKDSRQSRKENSRRQDTDSRSEQLRKSDVGNPIVDTLRQKGYEIISGVNIKNTYIDYIAVDANSLYLCLVDKEVGDWLADEERFNDEEPLWFSETNHRVSPVRMVDIARNILAKKLKSCKITFDLRAFVIIQNGNIINAEDMFEVWRGIDVDVTRINRGSPREIPLFSKSVDEVSHRIDSLRFESLKKLIRSIG